MENEKVRFLVSEEEAKQRIDKVIAERFDKWSRSQIQKWIDEEKVHVNGTAASKKIKLFEGDEILIFIPPASKVGISPQDVAFSILHEDEDVCVIDKPAGLVVHPAPGNETGTLVHGLFFRGIVKAQEDDERPGIVHRLDKDTSGVMVVAKTQSAKENLVVQFKEHSIGRKYQAIVVGNPSLNFSIETLYGRHPVHRKKFSGKVKEGKKAVTHVRVMKEFAGTSLCECTLETGRTHQIRVHLSESGFPVLGDPIYGKSPKNPKLKTLHQELRRQALHAKYLSFIHPTTQQKVAFESPVPRDMALILQNFS